MKISNGRYSGMLGRLLAGSGELEVAPELAQEISPVMVIEANQPEWYYLAGVKYCSANQLIALSAGNRSVVRFRNPANGPLAVLTSVGISTSTAGTWTAATSFGAATTDRGVLAGAFVQLDSRWGFAAGGPACVVSGDNVTGVVGINHEANHVLAGTTFRYQACPIVVTPGAAADFYFIETDQLIRVTLRWYERPLTKFERT